MENHAEPAPQESPTATWREKLQKHHGLLMILCCIIPVALALAGTYYFGWQRSYLAWLFLLLCPLMHYWMMKEMHGSPQHSSHTESDKKEKSGGKSCCH